MAQAQGSSNILKDNSLELFESTLNAHLTGQRHYRILFGDFINVYVRN